MSVTKNQDAVQQQSQSQKAAERSGQAIDVRTGLYCRKVSLYLESPTVGKVKSAEGILPYNSVFTLRDAAFLLLRRRMPHRYCQAFGDDDECIMVSADELYTTYDLYTYSIRNDAVNEDDSIPIIA